MFKRIIPAAALAAVLALAPLPLRAQGQQFLPGQVFGNSTASQRPGRAETVSDILVRAFGACTNMPLWGTGSSYACRTIAGADLPNPSTTTPGAIFSLPASGGSLLSGIGNDGAPTRSPTVFTGTAATLSGAAAGNALLVSQTWNTTGVPTAFKVQVFDTAHGAGALMAGFYGGVGGNQPLWTMDTSGNVGQLGLFGVSVQQALALYVGRQGFTNAAFVVDTSNATGVTGLKTVANSTGGDAELYAQGSAADVHLAMIPKGAGRTKINSGELLGGRLVKGVYVIAASAVSASITGTVAETTLATVAVAANSMGVNGIVRVTTQWSFSGASSTRTTRVKFGGTTYSLLAQASTITTARSQIQIANRNATGSQVGNSIAQVNWSGTTDATVTSAVDTTSAQNILITAQLGNTGDTAVLESYLVELIVP